LSDFLAGILQVFGKLNQELIIFFEEEDIVAKSFDNILQALAYFESLNIGSTTHVLKLQNLKNFIFLAILNKREETSISFLSDELIRFRPFLDKKLNYRIQKRLHHSFQTAKHLA
jgi:hypothetical protein